MAEVKDLEKVEQEATAPAMEETAADSAAPAETRVNLKARWQAIPRKKRRRIIRLCILALLLVIAAVVLLKVLGGKSSDEGEAVTDIVQYGSITSTYEGAKYSKRASPRRSRRESSTSKPLEGLIRSRRPPAAVGSVSTYQRTAFKS